MSPLDASLTQHRKRVLRRVLCASTDAAAYYCPYVPLTGGIADQIKWPTDFKTRYGHVQLS